MFRDVLKINPQLETKDLEKMQRALQSRFTKIAKNFGKGIANIFKGGGIAGVALALIDKVLNPLKEVQEAIDRTLKSSDDLATNAKQFNTTTGKLYKLVQLGKATGLDQDNLFQLVTKFQTAVAGARLDPNDPMSTSVVKYANRTDTADAFFEFIQALQRMDKRDQVLVQEQIFGQKQILKMADFLQQDFPSLLKQVGLANVSSDKFTKSIEGLAGLNDLADVLAVRRENQDILTKGSTINESMIRARDKQERVALERENQRIRSYQDLASISTTVENIMKLVEGGVALLGSLINKVTPAIERLVSIAEAWAKSPMARGIRGLFGGKDN